MNSCLVGLPAPVPSGPSPRRQEPPILTSDPRDAAHASRAAGDLRPFPRHAPLTRRADPPTRLFRIESGWAGQTDGRRLIALFLPGDDVAPATLAAGPVVALTDVWVREMPCGANAADVPAGHIDFARLTATERLCRLLADVFDRLVAAGQVVGNRWTMPLTPDDLATLLDIAPGHVNRVLQALRQETVMALTGHELAVLDRTALRRMGGLVSATAAAPTREAALAH